MALAALAEVDCSTNPFAPTAVNVPLPEVAAKSGTGADASSVHVKPSADDQITPAPLRSPTAMNWLLPNVNPRTVALPNALWCVHIAPSADSNTPPSSSARTNRPAPKAAAWIAPVVGRARTCQLAASVDEYRSVPAATHTPLP